MSDAQTAFDLETAVLEARAAERASWVPLAAALTAFHGAQAWRTLGHERFADWIAGPELSIGLRHAYRMIATWSWAADHGIEPERLARLDVTKLAAVIPAYQRDPVGLDVVSLLDDVEALSRSDLIAKYGEAPAGARIMRDTPSERCEQCGRQIVSEAVL